METQERLSHYEQNERRLTTALFSGNNLISNVQFTSENSYARYDGTMLFQNIPTMFEIKVRNFAIDRFDTLILQKDKYDSLSKFYTSHLLMYINVFTTELPDVFSAILFNVTKRIKQWGNNPPVCLKNMNDATFRSNYKVDKPVIMLSYDKSLDAKVQRFSTTAEQKKVKNLF